MKSKAKKRVKRSGIGLGVIILLATGLAIAFKFMTQISPPEIRDKKALSTIVQEPDKGLFKAGKGWLKKNKYGLWEMYLEGSPFERGVVNGRLSKELLFLQEDAFVKEINRMVPSGFYRRFLRYVIYWFNRDIDRYIPEEYKEEIYGVSLSASDQYSFIGSGYQRMLNYHSAHDIGHALQDLRLVGCTSLGAWSDMSASGNLLIGRNFDFYVGDEFARNKIVCFEKPDVGYAFMMVTWPGMIGAVSGMNEKGLTVTINAAKSAIPYSARTPISIVAREILQYASDIHEAYSIASMRETFVSESILIGSAKDNRAAVIEKSPFKTLLLESRDNYIVCTNHFRSPEFQADPLNQKDMAENSSVYRYRRVLQDLTSEKPVDPLRMAVILRDRGGLNGSDIGLGNEKAINQLIAHHSVILEPATLRAWVSTSPWQEGSYVCYDLFKIFHTFGGLKRNAEITEQGLIIPPDPFMETADFSGFLRYRDLSRTIQVFVGSGNGDSSRKVNIQQLISANPRFFYTYELAGDYYRVTGKIDSAAYFYRTALGKEVPRQGDRTRIIRKLVQCY